MYHHVPRLPKFRRFRDRLDLADYEAIGILESVWLMTEDLAPQGNIGRFTDGEIAEHIGWRGDPTALIEALADCRWLDRSERFRLVVHDWRDHAKSYIGTRVGGMGGYIISDGNGDYQTSGKLKEANGRLGNLEEA